MQRRSVNEWLSLVASGIVSGGALIAHLCLIGMLLIIFSSVFLRYVIGAPLYWSDEVMTYLMVIMVYAGFAFVLKEGRHVRMTVLFERLPSMVQNVLWIILSLLGTGYTIIILYAVIWLVIDTLRIGSYSMDTHLPLAPWRIAIALALFCLLVAFITLVIKRIAIVLGIRREEKEGNHAKAKLLHD